MYSLGLLIIRVVTGAIFVIHGIPKLIGGPGTGQKLAPEQKQRLGEQFVTLMESGGIANTAQNFEKLGVPNPKALAWVTALTEVFGGLAVILGMKTRPAALGLAMTQVMAIGKVNGEKGLVGGYEFNLLLLASAAGIAVAGPGKLTAV
jgi:putative oxidoreductase